jgi:membrane protein implicated in regulation of membrane protease activity
MVTAADVLVFVGMGALIAGLWGAFGWPWAAMVGGLMLLSAGAKLQAVAATKPVKSEGDA